MLRRQVPQAIQEGNVFINGQGYLGVTKKLKIPMIEFETIEAKGAISANYSAGIIKPMEVEFTISVLDKNMLAAIGLNSFTSRIPFLFKASIHQSGKDGPVPFSAAFTGDITSYEVKEFESGNEMEITIKLAANFVDINVDSVPMVLIDVENMICRISGIDYMASVRSNLGE
ncbi:phage major tail tube protein [Campylobacter gracilis]|jgi:phage tail tube protein FII|uniref:Putative phage major tail tube protein n=1 Tax=Campylobacter gracilis RM3268 TaxID=553220 RepID=C8PII9_9BACT|nr:phage major tail tube protein [Campylobacter gracilis]DAW42325.1 MAG TPA: tail tube protein [Caudoviricetes sp.]AKT92081.1 phage tail tube protein FII [Campylobacter gracilis]EEV17354.1 putative phage major tail tube protein [Campylobacter gracilis RM3268]UEB45724.1 phage major tail tube protein [Campylobacter gracilis]SUW81598.1 phage major tail tube protein [Campylobacter gracilis]